MSSATLTKKEFERQLYDGIKRETKRLQELKRVNDRKYYLENREALLEYQKRYMALNHERIKTRHREYYWRIKETETDEEREVRIGKVRQWQKEHEVEVKLYQKKYREKLKKRLRDKKYRENNREVLRLRNKIYREKNREEINRRARERNLKKKVEANVI